MTVRTEQRTAPARGDAIPDFTAQTPDGAPISSRSFYMRRNLALVFTHEPGCEHCRTLLRDLAGQQAAIEAEAATALIVMQATAEEAARLRDELQLPFPIAVDPDGEIHERYGLRESDGSPAAGIFIVDQYGIIYETSLATEDHKMLTASELPGWLEFIACQCS